MSPGPVCHLCGQEIRGTPRPWWVKELRQVSFFHESCLKEWVA